MNKLPVGKFVKVSSIRANRNGTFDVVVPGAKRKAKKKNPTNAKGSAALMANPVVRVKLPRFSYEGAKPSEKSLKAAEKRAQRLATKTGKEVEIYVQEFDGRKKYWGYYTTKYPDGGPSSMRWDRKRNASSRKNTAKKDYYDMTPAERRKVDARMDRLEAARRKREDRRIEQARKREEAWERGIRRVSARRNAVNAKTGRKRKPAKRKTLRRRR